MDLQKTLSTEPKFRQKQVYQAWFDLKINGYEEITTLSLALREKLKTLPWLTVKLKTLQTSKTEHTNKALLELADSEVIETVLMGRDNKKEDRPTELRYTICVSTQVGCPMNCAFCATGKMGFKRNLTAQEIVDQYRYWQRWLGEKGKIDNIVLMGQGEPLLNYDNVKTALNILLDNTDIGPRKITLSTAGVPSAMEKMLEDKEFPTVRFALSLHSATENTRTKLMPSHQKGFLKFLIEWSKKYHELIPSRAHFIGLEYTFLKDINDSESDLKALITLASQLGRVRINLIPYNSTCNDIFVGSPQSVIEHWHERLMAAGFTSTIRHSHGADIAAACGQLANEVESS